MRLPLLLLCAACGASDPAPEPRSVTVAREVAKIDAITADLHTTTKRHPKTPELGSTMREAEAICRNQGGVFEEGGAAYRCLVGDAPIFQGVLDHEQTSAVETFYEWGDLDEHRALARRSYGEPTVTIRPDGFRAFTYGGGAVTVSAYAKGVRLIWRRRDP